MTPDARRRRIAPVALALSVLLALAAWAAGRLPAPGVGARQAAAAIRSGASYDWLESLQSRFPNRRAGSQAHGDAVDWIAGELQRVGCVDVRIETLPSDHSRFPQVRNVHAVVPGRTDDVEVVLAAHHDTVDRAPGAIDDGGAVAAIVETARVLLDGDPPPCDVHVAVFDGEEWGLIGAKAHVEALGDEGRRRVGAVLAVELVGWHADRLVVHTIPHGFSWTSDGIAPGWVPAAVQNAGAAAGAGVAVGDPLLAPWYQGLIRSIGVRTGSDAGAYTGRGVPAAMLAGSSLTSFYDAYHTERDDMSQVDPARLDDAARVVAAAAWTLGRRVTRPHSRAQGDGYLLLAGSWITGPLLRLVGVVTGLLTVAAGLLGRCGFLRARCCTLFGAAQTFAGAVVSVSALVAGVPLAWGVLAALSLRRRRYVPACLGLGPLIVLVVALVMGASSFGFAWKGGAVEALAQAAVAVTGVLAAGAVAGMRSGTD